MTRRSYQFYLNFVDFHKPAVFKCNVSSDDPHKYSVTDTIGTLVALKDMLQSNLPRTEILVLPITDDQELPVLPNKR